MGDRGNIVIEQDGDMFPHEVYFYTHWLGSELKPILKAALERGRARWNDPQYLARVIFCELVGGDDGETGFGITTSIGDSGNKLLCVNLAKNTVRELDSQDKLDAPAIGQWTFEEFVAAKF